MNNTIQKFTSNQDYDEARILRCLDACEDDIKDHYKFITTLPPKEPEIDYDEYDIKFYMEEEEKENEKRLEEERKLAEKFEYEEDDNYYDNDYEEVEDDEDYDDCYDYFY